MIPATIDDALLRQWVESLSPAELATLVGRREEATPDRRTEYVQVRLSPAERQRLHDAAAEAGLSISAFVRERCGL